jgi:hypothetical protein
MTANEELEMMDKEVVVAYCKVLSSICLEVVRKYEKSLRIFSLRVVIRTRGLLNIKHFC